jgi:sugar phosphate isomerase/epimerase
VVVALKYSVILATLAMAGANVWQQPREVLEAVADAGYDAVDIDGEPNRIAPAPMTEVVETAHSLGLEIAGVVGAWGAWHAGEERDLASSDKAVTAHAVSYARTCIDLCASLGQPVFLICAAPAHSQYPISSVPYDVSRRNFVRSARQIADYAGERGVDVAIEPINRFEGYAGFLNSVADAVSVAEEVDVSSMGVMVDFFHANIEDTSIADALRLAGDRLLHIHLADSNRQAPGTGHIDFLQVIRTLNAMGYERYLALDCVPPKPDLKTFLTGSIGYMKAVEQAVSLQAKVSAVH